MTSVLCLFEKVFNRVVFLFEEAFKTVACLFEKAFKRVVCLFYNPANKSLRLVHILNEFFFTTSEEKAFPMTLSRADETLFTYVKRLST